MQVCLLAPFYWDRARLNAGEVVGLPDVIATRLVASGRACPSGASIITAALESPPADKLMRPSRTKTSTARARRGATSGGL